MPTKVRSRDTADRILDTAERLVQTRGFNGFSYADIADTLGVTKASLHYHFGTKAELGHALIARYHDAFARFLDAIDAETTVATCTGPWYACPLLVDGRTYFDLAKVSHPTHFEMDATGQLVVLA